MFSNFFFFCLFSASRVGECPLYINISKYPREQLYRMEKKKKTILVQIDHRVINTHLQNVNIENV